MKELFFRSRVARNTLKRAAESGCRTMYVAERIRDAITAYEAEQPEPVAVTILELLDPSGGNAETD